MLPLRSACSGSREGNTDLRRQPKVSNGCSFHRLLLKENQDSSHRLINWENSASASSPGCSLATCVLFFFLEIAAPTLFHNSNAAKCMLVAAADL